MNAAEVQQAYSDISRRYDRAPCRECGGCQTMAVLIGDRILVTCEQCGGATPKGQLAVRRQPASAVTR